MAIKTIEQFRTEATSEIESAKPLYAQVNNERKEFTDSEYDQLYDKLEQMEKAQNSIEKLKDADREIVHRNGNGHQ